MAQGLGMPALEPAGAVHGGGTESRGSSPLSLGPWHLQEGSFPGQPSAVPSGCEDMKGLVRAAEHVRGWGGQSGLVIGGRK